MLFIVDGRFQQIFYMLHSYPILRPSAHWIWFEGPEIALKVKQNEAGFFITLRVVGLYEIHMKEGLIPSESI